MIYIQVEKQKYIASPTRFNHLTQPSLRSKRFREAKNGVFGVLPTRKMGQEQKIGRWGRGAKETLADKPLDFENLRSPANGARDWLG